MSRLVTMPDAERVRLIADFWQEVSADLPADVAARTSAVEPRLPEDPTAAQLEAWITLAELLQDTEFRHATRSYLRETYATGPGITMSTRPVQNFIVSAGEDLMPKLMAAHASGLSPADPHVRGLATELVHRSAGAVGAPVDDKLWKSVASGFPQLGRIFHEALHDPDFEATHGRYLSLVATINGEASPDAELHAASNPDADSARALLSELGPWLSEAILAAKPRGTSQPL
jgi:hypothetical protein